MDVRLRTSITAYITLDDDEFFRATVDRGRAEPILIRALTVWAEGHIQRVEGRGVLIRRDGQPGRAERTRLPLRMEQLPRSLQDAITAIPMPEGEREI